MDAQNHKADSLLDLCFSIRNNTKKAELYLELGTHYRWINTDSAFKYVTRANKLAQKHELPAQLADSYICLGMLWHKKKNKDSTFFFLDKGYEIARVNSNYKLMVKSLNSTGIYNAYAKNYDEALKAYNEALQYLDNINDDRLKTMLFNNLALWHKANGNNDLALEYYHKALKLSEDNNDLKSIGLISSNMGLLYEANNRTDQALQYLNQSLQIRQKLGNKKGESYVRTNLGLVYENLHEYEKALEEYRKSLRLKQELNLQKGATILYNNMAIIFKKLAVHDSAFFYAHKALMLRLQLNDKLGEARTRTTLGQLFYYSGNNERAKQELTKALELAEQYKNYSVLQNIHSSLYNVYISEEDQASALVHLKKEHACKDSIFNIEKEKNIAQIETRYNLLKKEKEYLQLTQENELKDSKIERQIIIVAALIGILILFSLLLLFIFGSHKRLKEKNRKIEKQAQKLSLAYKKLKRLSKFKESVTNMLVHDLKAPLNIIVNYKDLKELDEVDDLVQQSGYSMQNLVHNILDVYKYQNTTLEINKEKTSVCNLLHKAFEEVSFFAKEKKLKFSINAESDYFVMADRELIKRVFINLFTNAIKYTPSKKTIAINMKQKSEQLLKISIANPGPGIPKEKQELIFKYFSQAESKDAPGIKSSGLGLSFCKMAVEAHQGEIGVISESETGATFWLTLPGTVEKHNKELCMEWQ